MWTLQRFHQSISHAHVPGSVSIVRVSKSHKRKFMWKVHRERLKGWRNFCQITWWTRFIWNSCRLILPSGNFWEVFFAAVRVQYEKKSLKVLRFDICFFDTEEKFNVKHYSPHTICQLFWKRWLCLWTNSFELRNIANGFVELWLFIFIFAESQEGWEWSKSTTFRLFSFEFEMRMKILSLKEFFLSISIVDIFCMNFFWKILEKIHVFLFFNSSTILE